jgi:hypothetical protein
VAHHAVSGAAVQPYGQPWFAAKNVYAVQEPGNWIFDFNAVAPGTTTVTFDFRRDDEPLSAAKRTWRSSTSSFVKRALERAPARADNGASSWRPHAACPHLRRRAALSLLAACSSTPAADF